MYYAALIFTCTYQILSEGSQFQWHQEYLLLSQVPPQPHISGNRKKIQFFVTKTNRNAEFTAHNTNFTMPCCIVIS